MKISDIEGKLIEGEGANPYRALLRSLSDVAGFKSLSVHEETLAPGDSASRPHSHSHKEEMLVVLSGSVRVFEDKGFTDLQAGGFMGFQPGFGFPHHVSNVGLIEARYLSIGSVHPDDQTFFA